MSAPPPVLIDVSRLIWRSWENRLPTGIDRACLAYVAHYRDGAHAVVQRGGVTRVLAVETSARLFALLLDRPRDLRRQLAKLAVSELVNRRGRPRDLRGSLYLNVGHTGLDQPGHARWARRTGVNAVYYVHDLIPITHPEYARVGIRERHQQRMRAVLRQGGGVIANSEDSLRALAEFAQQEGLAMPPALVAPLAVGAMAFERTAEPPLDGPYFVILGTIEGRKNHLMLLHVWRRLVESLGERTPRLVIIGQRGWLADEVFRQLDGDAALRKHVIELGQADDATVSRYLSHARALLFPSFVEGQGLPLIEALAAGTPVIASDLSVFRETAGDISDYLDPSDDEAWEAAIIDYAEEGSASRAAQVARIRGFVPPSWEKHFAQVDVWLAEQGLVNAERRFP